jgi:hypothetical protein
MGQSLLTVQVVAQNEPAPPAGTQAAGMAPAPLQSALAEQGAQSRKPNGAQ